MRDAEGWIQQALIRNRSNRNDEAPTEAGTSHGTLSKTSGDTDAKLLECSGAEEVA